MPIRTCPVDGTPLEPVRVRPHRRCWRCGCVREEGFDCPQCGQRMRADGPPPNWRCPRCEREYAIAKEDAAT